MVNIKELRCPTELTTASHQVLQNAAIHDISKEQLRLQQNQASTLMLGADTYTNAASM